MALTRNYSQRNSSWNAPYTFSGKEKDVETGYGYFGARYYDSGLSVWLSVDPLSDKYPSMSPYNYCANNPVMLVDPDGRFILIGSLKYTVGMNTTSGFEGKVITALNDLCTGSALASTMITYLAYTTSYTLKIEPTSKGSRYVSDGNVLPVGQTYYDQGKSSTVYMNEINLVDVQIASGATNSRKESNFMTALIHEISHAFHHAIGNKKIDIIQYGNSKNLSYDEVQATNDENLVRSQLGMTTFRTHHQNTIYASGLSVPSGPCLINIDHDTGVISSSDPTLRSPLIYYIPNRRNQ